MNANILHQDKNYCANLVNELQMYECYVWNTGRSSLDCHGPRLPYSSMLRNFGITSDAANYSSRDSTFLRCSQDPEQNIRGRLVIPLVSLERMLLQAASKEEQVLTLDQIVNS